MTSDGWNWSGPAPSQRRAPLISTPRPGTLTAISIAKATASSGPVSLTTERRP